MRNTLIKTGNEVNELTNEYNNDVKFLFEKWKQDYHNDINNCLDTEECHEEHLVFFKNIIFNRLVEEIRGFNWLNADELSRTIFYKHLRAIRINKNIAYDFMNRSIDGKRLNAFEGDLIPEVYAGAVWKFYSWLNEINSKTYIRSDKITVQLSLIELAYVCYFNKENITPESHYEIAKKYGVKPSIKLYQEYKKFVKDGLGSGTSSKIKDANKINRYRKIIPFIKNELGIKNATEILEKLNANYLNAIAKGLYVENDE